MVRFLGNGGGDEKDLVGKIERKAENSKWKIDGADQRPCAVHLYAPCALEG